MGYLSPIFQTHFRNLGMAGWIPHFQEHGNGKIMSITGVAVMQFSDPFPLPVGRYRQLFKDRLDPHGRPVPWPKPWPWWPWIEESFPPQVAFFGVTYMIVYSVALWFRRNHENMYIIQYIYSILYFLDIIQTCFSYDSSNMAFCPMGLEWWGIAHLSKPTLWCT